MTNNSIAVGADIGGTHITAALVNLDGKAIVPGSWTREKVDSHAAVSEIVGVWSGAIKEACKQPGIKISLAMPGPFDYETGVCLIRDRGKYENLYGVNVKDLLSKELDCRKEDIILINDAAAFLKGEAFGGAASGFDTAIGITLGTGLGTSIYNGKTSINADLWTLPFRAGIAEDYLCTRWFIKRYKEMTGNITSGVRELSIGFETDKHVQSIFEEFGKNLADFVAEFLSVAAAKVVVIGGNIAKSFELFKEPLLGQVRKTDPDVIIKTALLGEEAALLGAASHWKTETQP